MTLPGPQTSSRVPHTVKLKNPSWSRDSWPFEQVAAMTLSGSCSGQMLVPRHCSIPAWRNKLKQILCRRIFKQLPVNSRTHPLIRIWKSESIPELERYSIIIYVKHTEEGKFISLCQALVEKTWKRTVMLPQLPSTGLVSPGKKANLLNGKMTYHFKRILLS